MLFLQVTLRTLIARIDLAAPNARMNFSFVSWGTEEGTDRGGIVARFILTGHIQHAIQITGLVRLRLHAQHFRFASFWLELGFRWRCAFLFASVLGISLLH